MLNVTPALEKAFAAGLVNERLPCAAAWSIAETFQPEQGLKLVLPVTGLALKSTPVSWEHSAECRLLCNRIDAQRKEIVHDLPGRATAFYFHPCRGPVFFIQAEYNILR